MRVALCILLLVSLCVPTRAQESSLIPSIFTGHDLTGWVVPEGNIWFLAQDGVLKIKNGPDQQGKILWTEHAYGDFVMTFEFKMGEGTVDSGVFIRQDSEQIQIGESGSLKRDMTASPYIASKGYPVEAEGVAELLRLKDWNSMTIVARGNNYTTWLNGEHVMTYDSDSAADRGPVGLQLHANREMEIWYRDIRMAGLN